MELEQFIEKWSFPWPVMDVLIGGKSSIDLPELNVKNIRDAEDFIRGYGFDPASPRDQRKMHAIIVEAVGFIERVLIRKTDVRKGLEVPDQIRDCNDPRDLLVWASQPAPRDRQLKAWACAVLRVVHTIAHIEGVTRYTPISVAREQIIGRFLRHIFRDESGKLWLGDKANCVRLEKAEWKTEKRRDSIVLKLLHKRGNVAETIYDLLGVRLVVSRLCDVLVVVKYLRQFHMVTFANCIPSRSANTIIEVDRFKSQISTLVEMVINGSISIDEFDAMISRLELEEFRGKRSNPHSSAAYRSIQLTCRQLIRVRNPELGWLDKIQLAMRSGDIPDSKRALCEQLHTYVEGWHSLRENRELEAFFPFEVQILEAESYAQVISGAAAHDRYKASQLRAARRRVLGPVLDQY